MSAALPTLPLPEPPAVTRRVLGVPQRWGTCAERWKPETRRAHADGIRLHILPALGDRRVDAVTAKDVRNWFDDLSVTRAGTANRTLAVLSSMMKHAEALGLRREGSNPCKGLRRRTTGFEALGRALNDAEAEWPAAVAVVRFLLYTRRAQVRGAAAQVGVRSRRPRGIAR